MSYRFDSFRCGNCRKHLAVSERAVFPTAFKIASLITLIFWFVPSVSVWPHDVCKDCAQQVGLVTSAFIALGVAVAVGLLVHFA